jgi:hypothetical protein
MRSFVTVAALLLFACGDDSGSTPRPDAPIVVTGTAPEILTGGTFADMTAGTAAAGVQLEATGDTPITWAITSGAAPAGVVVSSTGQYGGTPTESGSFTFTITATNAAGSDTLDVTQIVAAPAANAVALLANNRILMFPPGLPSLAGTPVTLSGITAGEVLVAIDRRPVNGQLYGLAINAGSTTFTLYAIHPASGSAVTAAPQSFSTDNADATFGLDINPAVDRVRVVSGTGMNFRINPNTGVVIDSDGSPGNGNQRDTNLGGATGGATETAYTNNQINNANITTQYTVNGGTLYQQNPSNAGVLTTVATIAGVQDVHGFDIAPGVDAASANALVTSGSAYAIVKLTGQTTQQAGLINLVNGAFTASGMLPVSDARGLALSTGERTIVALANDTTTLLRFHESTPNSIGFVTLTGITAGETLVGIDFRPSTGQLFALGINATANTGTLYLVDPTGGAMTAIAAGGVALTATGGGAIDFPDPATARYGVDFNPTVDRVRVVTSTGINFRINPITGVPVAANPDTALNGTVSSLDNVAYTNGYPGSGAPLTTLYGISGATNSLYVITNPNGGTIDTAIAVKYVGNTLDFTSAAAFDIPWTTATATTNMPVTAGVGYAALTVGTSTHLYRIDLVTGASVFLGNIGSGSVPVIDIAVGQ